MTQMHMAKYVPDHSLATGMGGLLMGKGTLKVALAVARKYRAFLAASALIAEADAKSNDLPPGRIVEVFSKSLVVPTTEILMEEGHLNPRRAARVEVTGAYEGKDKATGLPKSSPVTIEFGSHYNEGTKRDRPDYRVMLRALRAQSAATIGMNVGREWT